jgi:hypothetical protein
MDLAEKMHHWAANNLGSHTLLEYYNQIKDAKSLTNIYEYIHDKYDYVLHEILVDRLSVEELYAISATEKFIREPNSQNKKKRDNFYKGIGFLKEDLA